MKLFRNKKKLLLIVTSGKNDGGLRAALAYSIAINALSFDYEVTMFLTGEGAIWGTVKIEDTEKNFGFPPISEMSKDLVEAGGKELLCFVCYHSCVTVGTVIREGVEVVGISSVIPYLAEGNAIVF